MTAEPKRGHGWHGVVCEACGRTVIRSPLEVTTVITEGREDCRAPLRSLTPKEIEGLRQIA